MENGFLTLLSLIQTQESSQPTKGPTFCITAEEAKLRRVQC